MSHIIARVVGSNSHIDYIGRIIDSLDVDDPPSPDDYCFAQFVRLDSAVGVIYDSKLINPEYASFGPRLSPPSELRTFSPDFINEQGVLIGVLLLGSVDASGAVTHGVPRRVISPGSEIEKMGDEAFDGFHSPGGSVCLHYYSQVVAHAGQFAIPLLQVIIDRICAGCSEGDRQRLTVLKQTLSWNMTLDRLKL